MSVELPFAPVDTIIRRNAGGLRVSADAAEELAKRIQDRGATLATQAAAQADQDGRKTIMAEDFTANTSATGNLVNADREALVLPLAPVDRIARLDIRDRYRVGVDARVALAGILEAFADEAADGAAVLARHAGRRTIQAEDFETYFELVE